MTFSNPIRGLKAMRLHLRAIKYRKLRQYDKAIQLLIELLERYPAYLIVHVAWLELADSYEHVGELVLAESAYRHALTHDSSSGQASQAFANFLVQHGRNDEAIPYVKQALVSLAAKDPYSWLPKLTVGIGECIGRFVGKRGRFRDSFRQIENYQDDWRKWAKTFLESHEDRQGPTP